jgi:class 3 adenylate cyclase
MSLIYNKCPFSSLKNPFITTSINLSKQFYLTFDLIDEPLDLFYTYIPMEKDGVFTESKSKVVVICIDFIDSTATLISQGGSLLSIDNSIKFHKEIVKLIRNVYYPFIYLHEVIGDSFIIALNTDWAYTSDFFCCSLALSFIFDLVHNTNHFVEIRTGMAYGTLHYGTIGSTFRFFGKPVNMASRLENKCLVNEIIICKDFYNKLILCMEYISTTIPKTEIIKQSINLKGFGDTECYKINIPEKGTFISYNNN